MVQNFIAQRRNLNLIPVIDILAIDEGHHCVSPSYRNIIKEVKKNPEVKFMA